MKVNYLRLSVTDSCNLNCLYCRPDRPVRHLERSELLRFEEMRDLVTIASGWGIKKVRITGGEPLMRNDVVTLVRMLRPIRGIRDLAMTTNGVRLREAALELKEGGLDRINVSLDSLRRERFAKITGQDKLPNVLRGMDSARKARLGPVRVNVVVLKGISEDEILDFVRFGVEESLVVRFIEYMRLNSACPSDWRVSSQMTRQIIEERWGPLELLPSLNHAPAKYYRLNGKKNLLGFISPASSPFCSSCNRLRLTAEGKLRSCLFSDLSVDLKKALREKVPRSQIEALFDYRRPAEERSTQSELTPDG